MSIVAFDAAVSPPNVLKVAAQPPDGGATWAYGKVRLPQQAKSYAIDCQAMVVGDATSSDGAETFLFRFISDGVPYADLALTLSEVPEGSGIGIQVNETDPASDGGELHGVDQGSHPFQPISSGAQWMHLVFVIASLDGIHWVDSLSINDVAIETTVPVGGDYFNGAYVELGVSYAFAGGLRGAYLDNCAITAY